MAWVGTRRAMISAKPRHSLAPIRLPSPSPHHIVDSGCLMAPSRTYRDRNPAPGRAGAFRVLLAKRSTKGADTFAARPEFA